MKTRRFLIYALAVEALSGCDPEKQKPEPEPDPTEYTISITPATGGGIAVTVEGKPIAKAVEGAQVTLTATPDKEYEFEKWSVVKATDPAGTNLITSSDNPLTFNMPAENVSVEGVFKHKGPEPSDPPEPPKPVGIEINGVVWAPANVDIPGTFAAEFTDPGMLYQWNRPTGWSSTDPRKAYDVNGEMPGATWNNTDEPGDAWAAENDPCPEGWRVPTEEETRKLCDLEKVTNELVEATAITLAGRTFTDRETNKSIFLPAPGYRNNVMGQLGGVSSKMGAYWTSTAGDASAYGKYMLFMSFYDASPDDNSNRANGYSVRCVEK